MKIESPVGENDTVAVAMIVIAAAGNFPSAGVAAADSASASIAWKKTYGACHAMPSPGSARIAGSKTDSAISEGTANNFGISSSLGFSDQRS